GGAGAANWFARIVVDPKDATGERCWIASSTGLWRREAGPVFIREPVPNAPLADQPVPLTLGAAATDVLVVPAWGTDRSGTYRIYVAFGAWGIFRGVFDPAHPAAGTVW